MEIDIEVFYHSDETLKSKNLEIEYSVLECDVRIMTFYNIDAISPYLDEKSNQTLCEIYVGERSFIATKSYKEIKEIIYNSHFFYNRKNGK